MTTEFELSWLARRQSARRLLRGMDARHLFALMGEVVVFLGHTCRVPMACIRACLKVCAQPQTPLRMCVKVPLFSRCTLVGGWYVGALSAFLFLQSLPSDWLCRAYSIGRLSCDHVRKSTTVSQYQNCWPLRTGRCQNDVSPTAATQTESHGWLRLNPSSGGHSSVFESAPHVTMTKERPREGTVSTRVVRDQTLVIQ